MTERFVSIEGVHGAGKSTVTRQICTDLIERGIEAVRVVDQSGTSVGRELRKLNLEFDEVLISPIAEMFIVAAARHQNVVEVIKPNLEQGKLVLSERYNDALIAFQHYGRGIPLNDVLSVASIIAANITPNLTILLDIDPSISLDRIEPSSRHRIEKLPLDFHKRVREGYLEISKTNQDRVKVFDASLPFETVYQQVFDEIFNYVNRDK